jgi:pyridoxal/pyridoxine/pyridoxamine kinase
MLTDMKISDERTAFACIDKLHDASVSLVVITSAVLGDDRDTLHIFGSWRPRGAATERFRLSVKRLPHPFIGTGDLLAALLMVRMWENLHNNASASLTVDDDSRATNAAARAVESSIASLQSVLARTLAGAANRDPRKLPTTPELALLESVDAVRHPTITIFAKRVTIQ